MGIQLKSQRFLSGSEIDALRSISPPNGIVTRRRFLTGAATLMVLGGLGSFVRVSPSRAQEYIEQQFTREEFIEARYASDIVFGKGGYTTGEVCIAEYEMINITERRMFNPYGVICRADRGGIWLSDEIEIEIEAGASRTVSHDFVCEVPGFSTYETATKIDYGSSGFSVA
jgi:hypothetical protein